MSQFYDQASLVMVPSGYKNGKVYSQKPLSASGELSFTRASSATRVNSSGLVEKVRTNQVLQSNSFDTTWTNSNSTETGGQAGYDGTNNAWLLSKSAAGGNINQTGLSVSGLQTFSIYAKAGTSTWVSMTILGGSNPRTSFDLVNGVVGTLLGSAVSAKIESVGNGYYRCSVVGNVTATGVYIYPSEGDADTSGTSGNILIQASQLETGDIATDYIATTSAAVSVGPVSGLPRLDYSGGCPSLLLEPQRTNLLLQSSVLDSGTWTKEGGSVSANSTTSPDGTANADLFTEDTSTGNHRVYQNPISTSANQPVTFSVFAKYNGRQYIYLRTDDTGNLKTAVFDIQNGTAGTVTSGATSNIENYGGGWYRCTITVAATANALTCEGLLGFLNGPSFSNASYTGNGTAGAYLWGFQGEANAAYATSYIPTLSTAVTRVADACSKTGISSLIGQTEGTVYIEMSPIGGTTSYTERILKITGGTDEIGIYRYSDNILYIAGISGGVTSFELQKNSAIYVGQTYKIAIGYKLNDVAAYVNGVQIGTDTSAAMFTSLANMQYANDTSAGFLAPQSVKQTLLFKTRLSNADLATLTTL